MENKEKYYTPEIEEFHIGFEYECLSKTGYGYLGNVGIEKKFLKHKFNGGSINDEKSEVECIESGLKNDKEFEIRVKYLDKEDIESFGFVYTSEKRFGFWTNFKKGEFEICVKSNDFTYLSIDNGLTYEDNHTYFTGIIKNKSEFKRLLKQLSII